MGLSIDRERFDESDYARFGARLRDSVRVLGEVLARPGFGAGPVTIGAELELALVDAAGRPCPVNRAILADAADPHLTLEANRYDVECATEPVVLAGRPFAALGAALDRLVGAVRGAAGRYGARTVAIGIVPTLRETDLQSGALTETPRYRALSAGLRRLRREPFVMEIAGAETLRVTCDDVTFEGANTAWQVHLKVPLAEFARTYNAAQIAIAPVLAVAGNAPTFLGRRLWDETRIALYRQSVDDRPGATADDWRAARVSFGHGWVRASPLELFAESVRLHPPLLPVVAAEDPEAAARAGVPALAELRLHTGTVWYWNRAVYDPIGGGHVRIEMRPLPAGPTTVDMLANTAFLIGLVLGLAPTVEHVLAGLTFGHARRNFYEAARCGVDAELLWPTDDPPSPRPEPARALVARLLPVARAGLVTAGVAAEEADGLLGVVAARAASGQTGARWQRATLARLEGRLGREAALAALLDRYLARAATGAPVHGWPLA